MLPKNAHRYTKGVSQGVMLSNYNQMYQLSIKFIKQRCKQVSYSNIIQYAVKRHQVCYQKVLEKN